MLEILSSQEGRGGLEESVIPGELEELFPVHEATVVLVDGPEGERGLVPLHSVRPGSGALALPPHLLQVVLDTATALGTLDKLLPNTRRTVTTRKK